MECIQVSTDVLKSRKLGSSSLTFQLTYKDFGGPKSHQLRGIIYVAPEIEVALKNLKNQSHQTEVKPRANHSARHSDFIDVNVTQI